MYSYQQTFSLLLFSKPPRTFILTSVLFQLEVLGARQSNLRTELPKRRAAAVTAQAKEKWLEFDPDVKDIVAEQARGTSYEKQFPLLLQRTGSRLTKYSQRDLNRRVKHFIQSGDLGFTLCVRALFSFILCLACVWLLDSMSGTTVTTIVKTRQAASGHCRVQQQSKRIHPKAESCWMILARCIGHEPVCALPVLLHLLTAHTMLLTAQKLHAHLSVRRKLRAKMVTQLKKKRY